MKPHERMAASWRVQSDERGHFDEIVVGTGRSYWLHAEIMDDRSAFIDVAGLCFYVYQDANGLARISYCEDRRFPETEVRADVVEPPAARVKRAARELANRKKLTAEDAARLANYRADRKAVRTRKRAAK